MSGVAFLAAFNEGRMQFTAKKVVVIGGGDTAMDVISVARRLGHIGTPRNDRPEAIIRNLTAHDVATAARREGSEVLLIYRRRSKHAGGAARGGYREEGRCEDPRQPGPGRADLGEDGAPGPCGSSRSTGRMANDGAGLGVRHRMRPGGPGRRPVGRLEGLETFDNGRGLIGCDAFYQVPGKPGYFACGDIVRPHLLTTAIGQAAIAADSIDRYLDRKESTGAPRWTCITSSCWTSCARPLRREYGHGRNGDRFRRLCRAQIRGPLPAGNHLPRNLFLGHFPFSPRNRRMETGVGADQVLGHFEERFGGLAEAQAQAEAGLCMSCGMCFECDNCVIYCPQDAVLRTPKDAWPPWAGTSTRTMTAASAATSARKSARPAISTWASAPDPQESRPATVVSHSNSAVNPPGFGSNIDGE